MAEGSGANTCNIMPAGCFNPPRAAHGAITSLSPYVHSTRGRGTRNSLLASPLCRQPRESVVHTGTNHRNGRRVRNGCTCRLAPGRGAVTRHGIGPGACIDLAHATVPPAASSHVVVDHVGGELARRRAALARLDLVVCEGRRGVVRRLLYLRPAEERAGRLAAMVRS